MSELKPYQGCDADKPFTRAIPEVGIPSGDSGYRVTIKCRDCGCAITRWALKKAWAIESAISAWNRRAQHMATVDTVEVVRCRDCIHFGECLVTENDYCSKGERKENR